MATDYKIVVVPDTGGTDHASSAPSVWDYMQLLFVVFAKQPGV